MGNKLPDAVIPNADGQAAPVSCPWCGFWSPRGAACDVCGSPLLAPKLLSITQLPDPGRSLEEQLSITVPEEAAPPGDQPTPVPPAPPPSARPARPASKTRARPPVPPAKSIDRGGARADPPQAVAAAPEAEASAAIVGAPAIVETPATVEAAPEASQATLETNEEEPGGMDPPESREADVLKVEPENGSRERSEIIVGGFADVTEEDRVVEPKRRRRLEWRSRRRQAPAEEIETEPSNDLAASESILPLDEGRAAEEAADPRSDEAVVSPPAKAVPVAEAISETPVAQDTSSAPASDASPVTAATAEDPPAGSWTVAPAPEGTAPPKERRTWLQRIWSAAPVQDEPETQADRPDADVGSAEAPPIAPVVDAPVHVVEETAEPEAESSSDAFPEPVAPEPAVDVLAEPAPEPPPVPERPEAATPAERSPFDLTPLDLSMVDRTVPMRKRRFLRRARIDEMTSQPQVPAAAEVPIRTEAVVEAAPAEVPVPSSPQPPPAQEASRPEPPAAVLGDDPRAAPDEPSMAPDVPPAVVFDTLHREFRGVMAGKTRPGPSPASRREDAPDVPVLSPPTSGPGIEVPAQPLPPTSGPPAVTGERKRGLFRKKRAKAESPAPHPEARQSARKDAKPATKPKGSGGRAASTKSSSSSERPGRAPARDTSLIWERAIAEVEATLVAPPTTGLATAREAFASEAAPVEYQLTAEGRPVTRTGAAICPTCGQPSQHGTCQACRDALRELQELMQNVD